jgi:hypothetical protein
MSTIDNHSTYIRAKNLGGRVGVKEGRGPGFKLIF